MAGEHVMELLTRAAADQGAAVVQVAIGTAFAGVIVGIKLVWSVADVWRQHHRNHEEGAERAGASVRPSARSSQTGPL
jgi:hypothetical protein